MKNETDKKISELFGYVCKHCKDPRATHGRPGMTGQWQGCFIGGCGCPGFELDNLKFLEQMADETDS